MAILLGSGFVEKNLGLDFKERYNIGNNNRTLSILKRPNKIFNILSKKKIDYPTTKLSMPSTKKNWLKKDIRSLGGVMINKFENIDNHNTNINQYFQKYIEGKTISAQFFVEGNKIKIYAFCLQWNKETKKNPFKLHGIRTTEINKDLQLRIYSTIKKVALAIKLNGLNSFDFIIPKNKKNCALLVDINPRPGLSINILSRIYKKNLFTFKNKIKIRKKIYTTVILYSEKKLFINRKIYNKLKTLKNSKNFSELPMLNTNIKKNDPICLLHTSSLSEKSLKKNIKFLENKIFTLLKG